MPPKTVLLVASGDLREAANRTCWAAQQAMEKALATALKKHGVTIKRAHAFNKTNGHGFIASQREGIEIFRKLDPEAPIIVAEAVWQYSHHVLAGLTTHRGPILTVANWSGQWPGLVGMLNLNGSLTKAGVRYSTLWSQDFRDDFFTTKLAEWLETGTIKHDLSHTRPWAKVKLPVAPVALGTKLAKELKRDKAIMGVFDEGCMGMFNAIIPDHALHGLGKLAAQQNWFHFVGHCIVAILPQLHRSRFQPLACFGINHPAIKAACASLWQRCISAERDHQK